MFMKQYLVQHIIISLLLLAGLWGWNYYVPAAWQHPLAYAIWAFFVLSSPLIHYFIRRSAPNASAFVRTYMAATTIKLFIYMGALIVYALFNKAGAVTFILHFFVIYLVFSTFETTKLFVAVKKKNGENKL